MGSLTRQATGASPPEAAETHLYPRLYMNPERAPGERIKSTAETGAGSEPGSENDSASSGADRVSASRTSSSSSLALCGPP